MLDIGRNVWRTATAERLAVVVDADRYFAAAREAFLQAEKRIMLIGWDFDARIRLAGSSQVTEGPETIGKFLYWLIERNPALELYLLRWDVGAVKGVFRGTTAFTVLKWMRHPRIHVKLDGHHPTGSSHHQKIVAIDDCLAFCGGIDMTAERWDTRAHRDDDPGRKLWTGRIYKPWHDATTAITGDAAAAIGALARERWRIATDQTLPPVAGAKGPCWPASLSAHFEGVEIGIARSQPEMPGEPAVTEVEALFLDQIRAARRHIYCESQYFASRRVAEAIAARLDEADGPEIVIINPDSAQGWLEPLAMDTARARLVEALKRRDRHGRLRLYHPFTRGGTPIYCHAKITIVDDTQLRIGSANINNRSLRLDTECDVVIDAGSQGSGLETTIAAVRDDLIAEHLDVAPARVSALIAETGSLIETIERLRGPGRSLRPYEVPDLAGVEKWLADNEVLDPEGPGEMFEPLAHRGLFRGRLRRGR